MDTFQASRSALWVEPDVTEPGGATGLVSPQSFFTHEFIVPRRVKRMTYKSDTCRFLAWYSALIG